MPNFGPAINANIQKAINSPQQQQQQQGGGIHVPAHLVQYLMYAAQLADAVNSASAFKNNGEHETNPMMKPFSHGGAPTMALGFGLGDLLRNAVLRHASPGTRNTADAAQAASNLMGILQTNGNKAPTPPPTQPLPPSGGPNTP